MCASTGTFPRGNLRNVVEPRLSVLIVEDNPDIAASLQIFLEVCGYLVTVATNGAAGVQAAFTGRPDAVICDIGLPVMDGFRVAEEIRYALSSPPLLIAVTGYGTAEVEERARKAGFTHFLRKPADPLELHRLLSQHRTRLGAAPGGPGVASS
jgi:two-component system, sensor histidine kinase